MFIHCPVLSLHPPDNRGIRKRQLMLHNKGVAKNFRTCPFISVCKNETAANTIMLMERIAREKNKETSMTRRRINMM
jgi:hypothetical protein